MRMYVLYVQRYLLFTYFYFFLVNGRSGRADDAGEGPCSVTP